ncbi:MAG: DNA-binding protein [Verrucomicrobia bacterium]|nr:DNA-binding protein [Verrucomicrobiota bacterium]MBU4286384.1 DNA-binding protein [Verrucomicrobiota bacterium]MBU4366926.1 DNA-binding protein [Verrucomicrobiota bacterium]
MNSKRGGSGVETQLLSERVQIERKQFFFDFKENANGRFLKVTEEVGGHRDAIIIPASGLPLFRETIDRVMAANS